MLETYYSTNIGEGGGTYNMGKSLAKRSAEFASGSVSGCTESTCMSDLLMNTKLQQLKSDKADGADIC